MNSLFYPKLAAGNIRKNSKTYLPYMLTCILTVTMTYLIQSLSKNPGIRDMAGAEITSTLLALGVWVTTIFAIIFLFYTNSFLMKRRKKEFGLYNILGMEKRHLCRVVFFETLYILVLSLVLGLALGLLFDKLMFLLFVKLVGASMPLGFHISGAVIGATAIFFCSIFVLILINSLIQIARSKPIELLQGGNTGEKEPKAKWILAILGLLALGGGYYISITVTNPIAAIFFFFIAVILVIIGTYLLFTAGSISLLKLLRKKKSFYYQSRHFISVSGMMYRMKQNAVGLGNVCILSTMVLVMVSSSLSLWLGLDDMFTDRYPRDVLVSSGHRGINEDYAAACEAADALLKEQGLSQTDTYAYDYLYFSTVIDGDNFVTDLSLSQNITSIDNVRNLLFMTLDDYSVISDQDISLEKDEVLLYSNRTPYNHKSLKVFDLEFKIKEQLEDFVVSGLAQSNVASSHYLVVKDEEVLKALDTYQKAAYGESASVIQSDYGFNLGGAQEQKTAYLQALEAADLPAVVELRDHQRGEFLALYGGFLFIGLFLGLLFIMATILIIYYKQISEGYDDQSRFDIMQKVGMSQSEVKGAIRSQILTVFFLPLVTAGIHVLFAFPFITRILAIFNLTDMGLFTLCAAGSFLAFALMYAVVYSLTAKIYYKIVKRG